MLEKDEANLQEILVCTQKILQFIEPIADAEALVADVKTYDAVMMNFILIGEAVARLTESFKAANTQIDWTNIKGFRNLVVHDYMGIDEYEVWSIIQNELPTLATQVKTLLP